ncbi:MAG: hypothetical protein EPN84_01715 [Legionella sp.]|nr:MAG: hypothetical protein EPN84_01715 [Legionella sp.]
MATDKTATERTLSQRTAALGASALRGVRTGTGPFLLEAGKKVLTSAGIGVAGGLVSVMGTAFGTMIEDIQGPYFGNPLAKSITGTAITYGSLSLAILTFCKVAGVSNIERSLNEITQIKNLPKTLIGGAFVYEVLGVLGTFLGHEILKSRFPESELPLNKILLSSAEGCAVLAAIPLLIALALLCHSCLICTEERCAAYAGADVNVSVDVEQAECSGDSAATSDDPDAAVMQHS